MNPFTRKTIFRENLRCSVGHVCKSQSNSSCSTFSHWLFRFAHVHCCVASGHHQPLFLGRCISSAETITITTFQSLNNSTTAVLEEENFGTLTPDWARRPPVPGGRCQVRITPPPLGRGEATKGMLNRKAPSFGKKFRAIPDMPASVGNGIQFVWCGLHLFGRQCSPDIAKQSWLLSPMVRYTACTTIIDGMRAKVSVPVPSKKLEAKLYQHNRMPDCAEWVDCLSFLEEEKSSFCILTFFYSPCPLDKTRRGSYTLNLVFYAIAHSLLLPKLL